MEKEGKQPRNQIIERERERERRFSHVWCLGAFVTAIYVGQIALDPGFLSTFLFPVWGLQLDFEMGLFFGVVWAYVLIQKKFNVVMAAERGWLLILPVAKHSH